MAALPSSQRFRLTEPPVCTAPTPISAIIIATGFESYIFALTFDLELDTFVVLSLPTFHMGSGANVLSVAMGSTFTVNITVDGLPTDDENVTIDALSGIVRDCGTPFPGVIAFPVPS